MGILEMRPFQVELVKNTQAMLRSRIGGGLRW
jgi:hypothetical protein